MKLLRHILSHGILLLILIALAFAYFYRVNLFSADINTRIDSVVGKAMTWVEIFRARSNTEPAASADAAQVQPEKIVTTQAVIEPVSESQTTPETEMPVTQTDVKEVAATDVVSTPVEQVAQVPSEPVAQQSDTMPVAQTTAPASVTTTEVATLDKQVMAEQEDVAPVTDHTAAATSHAELLNQARLAFQNGKPDKAITLYEELNELNPDNPNVHGELGNVFYSQGKWKQAGVAYYQAANLLLAQGQSGQVQYLYRVIQGLDEESAEKLRSQLGR